MERAGHFRNLARKRYGKRMTYTGNGDGPWVCMSKCTPKWSYTLHNDQLDAISAANKPCGSNCHKDHKIWMLKDEVPKPLPKPQPEDDQTFLWEKRLNIDGV